MLTITHLPPEVLLIICEALDPFDLECVAKTFNHALYSISNPLLNSHKEWLGNARQMTARFPPDIASRLFPSFPGHLPPLSADGALEEIAHRGCKALSLDPKGGPYIRSSPANIRSWIKLDGSFHWLRPLDPALREEVAMYTGREGDRCLAEDWQIDILVKQADAYGLKLPPGFRTFMTSSQLHHRIPSTSAWFFDLAKMIPCPPKVDDGAGGYLLRFHCDQQGCCYSYLYLSPSHGHHCVLLSDADLYGGRSTEIREQGNDDAADDAKSLQVEKKDFSMSALTFEEYLVKSYFEEMLLYRQYGIRNTPSAGLKDYVRNVYRSPMEVEHSRDYNVAIATFLEAQRWKGKAEYDLLHKYEEPESEEGSDSEGIDHQSANEEKTIA